MRLVEMLNMDYYWYNWKIRYVLFSYVRNKVVELVCKCSGVKCMSYENFVVMCKYE